MARFHNKIPRYTISGSSLQIMMLDLSQFLNYDFIRLQKRKTIFLNAMRPAFNKLHILTELFQSCKMLN